MELINPKAQMYAEHFSPQEDPLLNQIEEDSQLHPEKQMLKPVTAFIMVEYTIPNFL